MTGIKHHTPADSVGKILWSTYNEEHDAGAIADVLTDHDKAAHDALDIDADTLDGHDSAYFAVAGSTDAQTLDTLDSTDFVLVEDHTKAAHDALGIDAATLEGHTEAEVITEVKADADVADAISTKHSQNTDTGTDSATFEIDGAAAIVEGDARLTDSRTPLEHGNEAHSSTFLSSVAETDLSLSDNTTANASTTKHGFLKKLNNDSDSFMNGQGNWEVPPDTYGVDGARGKAGAGFVNNMLTLWDKGLGDVPDGFEEVSELAGTDFTIIKYVGGENETTIVTHNIKIVAGAAETITISDYGGTTQISAANETKQVPFVNSTDKPFAINLAKSTATDALYVLTADDTEAGTPPPIAYFLLRAPGESDSTFFITLPKACYIEIEAE